MSGVGSLGVGQGPVGGQEIVTPATTSTINAQSCDLTLSSGIPEVTYNFPHGFAIFTRDSRKLLTERGIRFANAPGGRPELIDEPSRISGITPAPNPPAALSIDGNYSGTIKFRFRNYRKYPVPSKVRF